MRLCVLLLVDSVSDGSVYPSPPSKYAAIALTAPGLLATSDTLGRMTDCSMALGTLFHGTNVSGGGDLTGCGVLAEIVLNRPSS